MRKFTTDSTGFCTANRPGFFYQPQTDARSWAAMRRFFDEIFAAQ